MELPGSDVGLTTTQAAERLKEYGPNRLPEREAPKLWAVALRQFQSPLIYILLAAAAISVAIGDINDAGFIGGVLLINALIGTWQEWKAEKSSSALKKLLELRASVLRDGELIEIDAEQLVPGDLVSIESGNRVPADLKLITSASLEIDESFLTGESIAVHKDAAQEVGASENIADRINMAFAGSLVTHGRGKGLVVATGKDTQVGRLAFDVVSGTGGKPPLLQRMERFTRAIAIATVAAALLIGTAAVAIGTYTLSEMFMFCIALAVSAIPEGLPVAITVALAVATTRMASRGVVVRRLTAVEGLGSCTMIATDKTGTLTCNALTVQLVYLPSGKLLEVSGEGYSVDGHILHEGQILSQGDNIELDDLARAAVLCNEGDLHKRNDAWTWRGDAVDVALLFMGRKAAWQREKELEHYSQVNQIPYEPELQFAATFHQEGDQVRVFVKGAPEKILKMCVDSDHAILEKQSLHLASQGFRLLALADGLTPPMTAADVPPTPKNLRFLGFVAMRDPLRPGTAQAVKDCKKAGIHVTMITGDHRVTALAIARELGLTDDDSEVVTGVELAQMNEHQLAEVVQRVRVFARIAPHQKLEIVKAAQRSGHFVAVTGDGVNDAPALQEANIGVAMGKSGTDVAREAAELVIRDDNFATIIAGIDEGRVAYDNIRKVIFLLVSTGAAEVAMVLFTILFGLPLPLLAVQLLWLNLVTNGIQGVALAFEPSEGDMLSRKPRSPHQPIFDRLMIERMLVAVTVMGGVGFGAFYAFVHILKWPVAEARNGLLLLMVLFENIHIGNCRSETRSAFTLSPLRSPMLLAGALCAFLLHMLVMYLPWGQKILGTYPMSLQNGLIVFALALTILPAMELHRWFWKRRHPT